MIPLVVTGCTGFSGFSGSPNVSIDASVISSFEKREKPQYPEQPLHQQKSSNISLNRVPLPKWGLEPFLFPIPKPCHTAFLISPTKQKLSILSKKNKSLGSRDKNGSFQKFYCHSVGECGRMWVNVEEVEGLCL